MARIVRPVLAWALLAAAWSHAAIAGDVLRYVPADALGFIVIHDLEATNDKIVAILKVFERIEGHSIVDPLRLIKAASGLADDGLDAHGDALFALLATGEELEAAAQAYRPMLLTPVSDYAALAASLNADPTGAISRVTIVGQSVHIAQWGQFALLMDEQHRPTMEALLAGGEPEMLPQVAALAEWIGRHDVAAALLPAGVTAMTAIARAEVAAARGEASRQPADEAFAEELAQMEAGLDMYEGILAYLDEQVESTVVGIAIDDQLNIVARNQLLFHAPSDAAAPIVGSVGKPGALDRHRDELFVFAAGGALLPLWGAGVNQWSRDLVQSHPGIYGFEEFNETQWAQFEEVSKAWLDVRSLSAAMLVGSDKDPLYSNFYLIAEVAEAPAYMAALRRSM
ncbi:MAG TPA: hypothetical protein PKC18_20220, partial [Lacipirellulaceae bacterium]|nr:hypothetical protein [Lacipirellulaceae bacterium]